MRRDVLSHQCSKDAPDDGLHPAGNHNDRDRVSSAPFVERQEARIEFDLFGEDVHAFLKGELLAHALERHPESVPEAVLAGDDLVPEGSSFRFAHSIQVDLHEPWSVWGYSLKW